MVYKSLIEKGETPTEKTPIGKYVPLGEKTLEERESILKLIPKEEIKISEPTWLEKQFAEIKSTAKILRYLPEAIDETLGITKAVKEKSLPRITFDVLSSFGEAISTAAFRFGKSIIAITDPELAERLIPEETPHPTELLLRAIGKEEWIKTSKPVYIGLSAQEETKRCIAAGSDIKLCALMAGSGVIFDAAITGGIAQGILRGFARKPVVTGPKAADARKKLEVGKRATQDEIKKAYYKKAHQTHPDKIGGNAKAFEEINRAYQSLTGVKPQTVKIREIAFDLIKERPYPWQKIAKEVVAVTPTPPPPPPRAITPPPEIKPPTPPIVPEVVVKPPVVPPVAPVIPAVPPVIPPAKPLLELKGLPEEKQVLKNIEMAENELRVKYKEEEIINRDNVEKTFGEVWSEFEMSEAGERMPVRDEEGYVTDWLGKESSFPEWIPEELRSKDLLNKMMDGLIDIESIKYPTGNKSAQRELYNLILDEIDTRLKVDTKAIRSRIMQSYEGVIKEEVSEVVRERPERREAVSAEEVKVKPEVSEVEKITEISEPKKGFEFKLGEKSGRGETIKARYSVQTEWKDTHWLKTLEEAEEFIKASKKEVTAFTDEFIGENLNDYIEVKKAPEKPPEVKPPTAPKPTLAKEEFKVGEVFEVTGNMVSPATIRKVEGNSLYFTDAEGTDYGGMARSTVRNFIKEGVWKKISKLTPEEKEKVPKVKPPAEEKPVEIPIVGEVGEGQKVTFYKGTKEVVKKVSEAEEMKEMEKENPYEIDEVENKFGIKEAEFMDEEYLVVSKGEYVVDTDGAILEVTSGNDEIYPNSFLKELNESNVRVKKIGEKQDFMGFTNQIRRLNDEELTKAGLKRKVDPPKMPEQEELYRVTSKKEKQVPDIVKEGDIIRMKRKDGYSKEYQVEEISGPFNDKYPPHYSLSLSELDAKRTASGELPKNYSYSYDNEVVAEGGQLKKLFKSNSDETIVLRKGPPIKKNESLFGAKFKMVSTGERLGIEAGKMISQEEAIKIIRKYFNPKEVGIDFKSIHTLAANILSGQPLVYGYYRDSMVNFMLSPRENVPEHEVVHAYLDLFTTEQRKLEILKEVREKYKLSTLREAEEQLADDFIFYVKGQRTFPGKILKFLSDLLAKIKKFFNKVPRNKALNLYEDIIAERRPMTVIKTDGIPKYKLEPLSADEVAAYGYIEKKMPMPEELKSALQSLKDRGIINKDYISPIEPPKAVTGIKKKTVYLGTVRPGQIVKIETVVKEKEVPKQIFNRLKNGFTGRKRTKIEELSEQQADDLYRAVVDLTPDQAGKIRIVNKETLEVMKDFIPPGLLQRKAITTGDIYKYVREDDVNYILSLARPVRKVLTSGEMEPNQQAVGERIYDTISEAEENFKTEYRDWYREYTKLYKKAREIDKNVDENVFGYIEKGWVIPENTKVLAEFLKDLFTEAIPVVKPVIGPRKRYITHTAPEFWEKVKVVGFREALRGTSEIFLDINYFRQQINPDIVVALDYIVSKVKFDPFALPRHEYRLYSKKLRKVVNAYVSLYFYKKNFDPIMPGVLKMKKFLPPGKQMYVQKYLQTVSGRPLDFRLWQGKMGRTVKKAITTGIRAEYGLLLGLNVASGLGNLSGGSWNNIADIDPGRLSLGHQRLVTKQGRRILDKYGLTEQALYLEPVGGTWDQLSKVEKRLFIFMQLGEIYLRGSAALGLVPESEFHSGELSSLTRARIRRQIARTQGLFGPAQAPLLSQTAILRPYFMFKHWMINEIELLQSFGKEFAARFRRNPDWKDKVVGNEGLKKITKWIILAAIFWLFGPEFLKKEVRQKFGIPKTLLGTLMDPQKSAVLYSDVVLSIQILWRIGNQEYREAREEIYKWVMRKPILSKHKDFFEGFITGAITTPTGELEERITKAEAVKRWMVGGWTEKAQTEQKLNKELSKLLPFETYTEWDWDFGPRRVKTDYQKIKEDVMSKIKKKGFWDPEAQTIGIDKEIERMFAIYNGQALKRLDLYFTGREKITGEPVTDKEYNSIANKVTIQEKDIARWFETAYEQKTVPRILRRTR